MAKIYVIGNASQHGDDRVYSVDLAGVYTQIGNSLRTVTTLETSTFSPAALRNGGNVIDAAGQTYLAYNTGLFKLDKPTNTWRTIYSTSAWAASAHARPTAAVMNISGVPYVVGGIALYEGSFIFWSINTSNDSVTTSSAVTTFFNPHEGLPMPSVAMTGNYRVFSSVQGFFSMQIWDYNPVTNVAIANRNTNIADFGTITVTVHRNVIYGAWRCCIGATDTYLIGFIPGTATVFGLDTSIADSPAQVGDQGSVNVLTFSDNDYLYLFYLSQTGGFKVLQYVVDDITKMYTSKTDITDIVLPSTLKIIKSGDRHRTQAFSYWDQVTQSRYIFTYRANTGGGAYHQNSFDVYKWNGPNAKVTKVGKIGNIRQAFSFPIDGGGANFYQPGKIDSAITSITSLGNGDYRIGYRIYESTAHPSGTPVSISFAYGSQPNLPTSSVASLKIGSSSPDGTVSNNTVIGITAGSGVARTVDWRAATQGTSTNRSVFLTPTVELA